MKEACPRKLIELLAIPLSDQKTVAKWLVNEKHKNKPQER